MSDQSSSASQGVTALAPPDGGITHRRVLGIALPIVLSNITVPLLGIVDTAVVGQLGAAAPLGAVAVGAVIIATFYWLFGFLRMGTVGLASQAKGRGDQAEVVALLMRVVLIGLGAGLCLMLLQAPLIAAALWVAAPSEEVAGLAREYLQIRIWSAPAQIALYGLSGWLIAQERSRAFMVLQIWMNGLNMLLDLWFVMGLGWGVSGVAFATFLAEWSGLALGLWFCRDGFRGDGWRNWAQVLKAEALWHMAAVNGDILIRSLLLQAMFTTFTFIGARQGDVALAANQVLLQMLMLTSYGLDGFAFAAETLVGQAVGARRRTALRRAAWVTSLWGTAIAVFLSLAFWNFGGWMIDLMSSAPGVRQSARAFLPYVALVPLVGCAAFMLDGIFIGATATRDMRNMMVVSAVIYGVSLVLLLPLLGNHGLWLALLISFIARGVTLVLRYPALEARAA